MRVWSLTKRLFKQIIRDKRSVALLFVAPLIVLWLMSLVLNNGAGQPRLDVISSTVPPVALDSLKKADAIVHEVQTIQEGEQDLQDHKADAYMGFAYGGFRIVLEGSDPSVNQSVMQAIQKAEMNMAPVKNHLDVRYLHGGSSLSTLDYTAPVLIGFFIFFFVFLISGVAFLRERTGGTLERMLATPVRRTEIVLGYFFGFGLFAVLQTALVQWFVLQVLHVQSVGSFGAVLVINVLLATVALSLGTLLSAFARNEFQMVQFIPLVVVPQIFLSGLFNLHDLPKALVYLSNILPLTHAANALRGVMIRGESLGDIKTALFVLCGYCVLFLTLNVFALGRYRKV